MKRVSIFCLLLTISLSFCHAQKAYTIEYNLKKGDIFTQELITNANSNMEIIGQNMNLSSIMTMIMQGTVMEKNEDTYTIEMKFNEITINMEVAGTKTSFSSDVTKNDIILGNDLGPLFKSITTQIFVAEMSKTGKLLSITGFEELAQKMMKTMRDNMDEEKMEELLAQLEGLFSSQSMTEMFDQTSAYYPAKPVKKKDSWTNSLNMGAAPFSFQSNITMTLKKIKGNIATIQCKGEMATKEDATQEVMGMDAKISVNGTITGYMYIDLNNGLPIKNELNQNIEGSMEILGMAVPLKVKSKTTATTTK